MVQPKILCLSVILGFSLVSCSESTFQGIGKPDDEESVQTPDSEDDAPEEEIMDRGQLISSDLSRVISDLNYKRGAAGPGTGGFYDTDQNRAFIDRLSSKGVNVFVGCHNYYREETPKYNELYNWDTGAYEAAICDLFVDIRVQAYQQGIEMINIMGSCPKGYRIDPDYMVNDMDQPLPDDEKTEGEDKSPMETFQGVLSDYIRMSEAEIGRRLGVSDYHSIWCGSDEPAHSIGDPVTGLDDDAKIANIRRYVKFWKPIEESIHSHGGKVGGLQLNSSNSPIYLDAVKIMIENQLHLDYLTYIFYYFGKESDFDKALEALDYYNANSNDDLDTKMILLRGDYRKPETVSFCRYLIGEKLFMEHAEKIHSYSLDCSTNGSSIEARPIEWDCRFWVMTRLGDKYHAISNLPENIDGFVTSRDGKVVAAIWNFKDDGQGNCVPIPTQTVSLELKNADIDEKARLNIRRFKGYDELTQQVSEVLTLAKWDKKTRRIVNIELRADEFVLLELE